MNPIRPEDLFAPQFSEKLNEIIASLEGAMNTLVQKIGEVKNAAGQLASAPVATNQAQSMKKWADNVQALSDEYKALLQEYGILAKELSDVTSVQRDQNQILKLQSQYAEAAEGSFNKMSAEYRLLKVAANALNPSLKENAQNFERLQKRMAELYDSMNKYQQSTGKFQMQVGDYSKALNGLNLSTQQILRELPTLANSTSQFFMAISNNVPIFIDNFKRARQELGSFTAALKGTMTALFSWQTVLLVLLTLLPKIAKAIHDKKKAQAEANKETKEAFDREKELLSIEEKIVKSEQQSAAELKAVYAITQDLTRSEKERAEAAKYLQQQYPETLGNYSQEAILAGDAADAVDRLTNSLVLQARARGYLNVIEELSEKEAKKALELQKLRTKESQQQADLDAAAAKAQKEGRATISGGTAGATVVSTAAGIAERAAKSALDETQGGIKAVKGELEDIRTTIVDITDLIPTEGLLGLLTTGKGGGGKGAKESALGEIPDYILEYYDALIAGTENAYEKILLQRQRDAVALGMEYEKDYAKLQELETKAIKQGNQAAVEEIHRQMALRTDVYNQEMDNLEKMVIENIAKLNAAENKELTDPLADVRRKYVEALTAMRQYADNIQQGLDEGRKIGREELADWQNVIREKIKAEAEYQKAKKKLELQGRLDALQISQAEYDDLLKIEMAKIDTAASKAMDKIGYKKGKKWNIWTALFGTDIKDEATGTITRVIGEDVKYGLDQTLAGFKSATKYVDEYIDALSRAAQQAEETANTNVEMAKKILDAELEAKANGYANSVDLARKEYEEQLALQKKAQQESAKIQRLQLAMESESQAASLMTATANIIAAYSKLPVMGQAMAIASIATMWGTFFAAKIRAGQVTKYGEGMSEYLDYGGSHASGNDIDFGVGRDGRRRRVERGEVIGVINKRNVRKYGSHTVRGIIDSLNKGNFEYKYGGAFTSPTIIENASRADLSRLEGGVNKLVQQGEYRESFENGKKVIQYKNLRRVIR